MNAASSLQQTGVALVMALLLVAIASAVAIQMASQQQLEIHRITNLLDHDRAAQYALGAERWVKQILMEDDPSIDHWHETWATRLQPLEIEGGQISGQIEDLQGRFNVNNLWNPQQKKINVLDFERFQRLLTNLNLDPKIASAVVDWLDDDINPVYPDGVEELDYLRQQPPYRTADGPLVDDSELRLIAGIDAAGYQRLQPHITTLPGYTSININTATDQVLLCLSDKIDGNAIKTLLQQRKSQTFDSVTQFLADPVFANAAVSPSGLAINSHYFQADARIQMGNSQIHQISRLYRANKRILTLARTEALF